jgi:nucleoside phosphorylase
MERRPSNPNLQNLHAERSKDVEEKQDENPVSSETKRRKANRKSHSTELTHNDYTVGWVCALPKEQTAATAMLDQRHADLLKPPNDPNTYTLGSVGKHNIVIACLPKGKVGTNPAVTVAAWMISTFPFIKFGLMVGIGGGIPPKVRLGDVVVSTPVDQFPGVVEWDFGKAKQGGNFERTGALNNPPSALLTAVTKLETEHELNGSKIPEYLDELKQKWPRLASKYVRSDSLQEILFKPEYGHVSESTTDCAAIPDNDDEDEEGESCRFCDRTQAIKRKPRDMRVHYGLIASGNQVIKDAEFRDTLNKNLGGNVLCVEMEAAGLMNDFPCIIIRGICDYADSHKNKDWQEHAAAVAAAFAKELLSVVPAQEVEQMPTIKSKDHLFPKLLLYCSS